MSITYVKATCHCSKNAFMTPFVTSELPLVIDMCHCNSCRHTTGQLYVHAAPMDGVPLSVTSGPHIHQEGSFSNLRKYSGSPKINRYFCSTCFAYMFYEIKNSEGASSNWMVSTGSLERIEGIVKVGYHIHLADTLDGGMTEHYRVVDGVNLPRYSVGEGSDQVPLGWRSDRLLQRRERYQPDRLHAYCHCGSISLYLSRPDLHDINDPTKWWATGPSGLVTTGRGNRFTSGHCACTSCRVTSGSLIQSWVVVSRENVFDAHLGQPVHLSSANASSRPENLIQYQSSASTFRESYGICGARVFGWTVGKSHLPPVREDGEPVVIDIGAGLVDQEVDGVRAENWCSWMDSAVFPEDVIDKPGLEALQMGLKVIGIIEV